MNIILTCYVRLKFQIVLICGKSANAISHAKQILIRWIDGSELLNNGDYIQRVSKKSLIMSELANLTSG